MASNNHTSINTSVSKQLFSFSKSSRFPMSKTLNNRVAYEVKSEFEKPMEQGAARPFHNTSTRFNYYASPKKAETLPSPSHYKIRDTFGKEAFTSNS